MRYSAFHLSNQYLPHLVSRRFFSIMHRYFLKQILIMIAISFRSKYFFDILNLSILFRDLSIDLPCRNIFTLFGFSFPFLHMFGAHTSCSVVGSSFCSPPLFFLIFPLSRMRPISSILLRLPFVAIDQPVLYHGATCVHILYRRCRIMAIRQRGFASINCYSNQR